jgi:hypothetical protein
MLITLNLLDLWGEKIPDLFKGKDLNLMDKTIEDLCKKLSHEELKKELFEKGLVKVAKDEITHWLL